MPNHVTNVIYADPAVAHALTRHHTDDEKADLRRESADRAVRYQARTNQPWPYADEDAEKIEKRFVDFALVIPEPDPIYRGGCDMHHPHVVNGIVYEHCWNGWNSQHWGTKWNGYDTKINAAPGDLCRLQFDTAWSHPWPVVAALSLLFPGETIRVEWADEDFGSNLGTYSITAGEVVGLVEPPYGSDAANELAARLKYGKPYAEVKAEWDADEVADV